MLNFACKQDDLSSDSQVVKAFKIVSSRRWKKKNTRYINPTFLKGTVCTVNQSWILQEAAKRSIMIKLTKKRPKRNMWARGEFEFKSVFVNNIKFDMIKILLLLLIQSESTSKMTATSISQFSYSQAQL